MNLIIIGASARAAAFSAHRAGLKPWCVDLFADADLQARFPVRRVPVSTYPQGLFDALADAPDGPLLYTGGLENHPELLAQLHRPIWGNPPEVLRRVRDPFLLDDVLRRHGFPAMAIRRSPPKQRSPAEGAGRLRALWHKIAGPPRPAPETRWLVKPLRGSGGLGIRHYDGKRIEAATHYLQEYIDGTSLGGLFFGIPGRQPLWLGAAWSFNRDTAPWLHAPRFHYAGGAVSNQLEYLLLKDMGTLLGEQFGLAGLYGVDAVVGKDAGGSPCVRILEVNPRYTASVELLERYWRTSLLALQRSYFECGSVTWQPVWPRGVELPAKAILYARRTVTFPPRGPWEQAFDQPVETVEYADIPPPNTTIATGRPVMTVFASGEPFPPEFGATYFEILEARVQALDRHLYG